MTTIEILEALRAHFGGVSDYRAGKNIGARQQLVSQWRTGQIMSDTWAIRCADVLHLPRAYLIACVNAERARAREDVESSGVYRQIADAFRDRVALWALVSLLAFQTLMPSPAGASGRLKWLPRISDSRPRKCAGT